jgi:hypothetical protein
MPPISLMKLLAFSIVLLGWIFGAWWFVSNVGFPPRSVTRLEGCMFEVQRDIEPAQRQRHLEECLKTPALYERAIKRLQVDNWRLSLTFAGLVVLLPIIVAVLFSLSWRALQSPV